MSPDQEDQTLHAGGAKSDLLDLAGDDGGHLLLGQPPDDNRGQFDLSQPHQLRDGK